MPNFPATLDDDTSLFLASNLKRTTLNGSHTNSVTTLTVVSTTGFPSNGWLRLEEPGNASQELVTYTGKSSTTFTGVTRAADPDFAAFSHVGGVSVTLAVVAQHHNTLKDTLKLMQGWSGVVGSQIHAPITNASSPYTILSTDVILPVDASSGPVTLVLPTAVGIKGRAYYIIKTDTTTNAVTIDGNGSQTINTNLTYIISIPNAAVSIVSDNANWIVTGNAGPIGMFDTIAARDTAGFKTEGMLWFEQAALSNGSILQVGTTSTAAYNQGTFNESVAGPTSQTIDLANGTVIEYVSVFWTNKLPSNANDLTGVCLTDVAPAAATFQSTSAAQRCVVVGIDNTGAWKIYTCNATTKTVTTPGGTASINTKYKVKIVWTVGTNIVVTIDNGTPTTITATLPTRMTWHGVGKAATNASGDRVDFYGGAWRFG